MEMIHENGALEVVDATYRFLDRFMEEFPVACRPGCSSCCTTNLFATSAEAALAARALEERGLGDGPWRSLQGMALYRPTTTTNEMARACLERRAVEDGGEHVEGACPLLSARGLCSIYPARPLVCRAMHSLTPCPDAEGSGAAEMDGFLMELQLVLYQVLEEVALLSGGRLGNLFDHLAARRDAAPSANLLTPRPFPGLVVMPVNRGRLAAFLRRLLRHLQGLSGEGGELARRLAGSVGPHVGLEAGV